MAEGARLGLDYSYSLIDFDALGLPDSQLGDRARRSGARAASRASTSRIPSSRASSRISTRFRPRPRRSARSTRSCSTTAGPSGTTPIAGALPRASARRCTARIWIGSCSSAPAARARRWRVRCAISAPARSRSSTSIRSDRRDLAASLNSAPGARRAAVARDVAEAAARADGIVNTTPVGMAKYPGMPVPASALGRISGSPTSSISRPRPSCFARPRPLAAGPCPGRGMAVFQAVKAFELITGRRPDAEAMFRHFESAAAERRAGRLD